MMEGDRAAIQGYRSELRMLEPRIGWERVEERFGTFGLNRVCLCGDEDADLFAILYDHEGERYVVAPYDMVSMVFR